MDKYTHAPSKILGVLGGMGPAATAEFLRLLCLESPAKRDQEHPIVFVFSDAQIPDRNLALLEKGEDPGLRILHDLETLQQWGANVLAIPCNTAHVFIDPMLFSLKIPFIHIVDACLAMAETIDPTGAWLCATEGTVKSGIYQRHAKQRGFNLYCLDRAEQEKLTEIVTMVKGNEINQAGENMLKLSKNLWKLMKKPLLLGCTEIPLAYNQAKLPEKLGISSLRALAHACVRYLYSS